MKKYVILISGVAALSGLLFGFDTAVIAGTLTSLKTYFDLGDSVIGLVVAAASIGCIPGAFFAGRLADHYGRNNIALSELKYFKFILNPYVFSFLII